MYESFAEKLNEDRRQYETLSHKISDNEEEDQLVKDWEKHKQMGIHLYSTLTTQTQRRVISTTPKSIEELQSNCKAMTYITL